MTGWWLSQGWYLAFWIVVCLAALIAARLWLINPLIRAIEQWKR